MRMQLLCLLALGSLTGATPASQHVVHEKRNVHSLAWQKRSAVPGDMIVPMRIGLKQRNLDRGYDLLMDRAHPSSSNYGKHYTADQVIDLFAPEASTVDKVRQWLQEAGVKADRVTQSANKGWLQFDAPASEAEGLLKTHFFYFEHLDSGDVNMAADEYSLPAHLRDEIDYVTPGVKLLVNPAAARSKSSSMVKRGFGIGPNGVPNGPIIRRPLSPYALATSGCDKLITPDCIRQLYDIPKGSKAAKGNQLGVYEYGDYYLQSDLDDFYKNVAKNIPAGTHPTLDSIDGGVEPAPSEYDVQGETELDLELAYPLVWPQGITLLQVEDPVATNNGKFGLFNNFLNALDGSYCTYAAYGEKGNNPNYDNSYPDTQQGGYNGTLQCGVYKAPNVISISYGVNEADYTPAYQQRMCNEFMKLGLQGVSIVVASGDSGVGGRPGQNGHTNGCLGNGTVFNPDYPGTCPYLTMVGSTVLPPGKTPQSHSEIPTESFSSGGGFSNIYPVPAYQKDAVAAYFKNADPIVKAYPYYNTTGGKVGKGMYNRGGRGYPDVSAVGDNILVWSFGQQGISGGTSASAPIFASILNLINEERLAAGKSTVGFVNPVLYANPGMFHDVAKGNNTACGTPGFLASKGWDPVTGMGTPNFPAMLKVFLAA